VGFVFSEHDPFIGIDLDKCRDESWALDLVASCSTYTEITPSGNGFHLIGLGVMPGGGGRRKGAIEIYDRRRFFTMTGAVFGECPLEPIPVQPQVDALLARWTTAVATRPKPTWTPSLETGEILRRALLARNGDKVSRLYRGDTSGYASGSEADFALLWMRCSVVAD
jgi:putative DNA primase/helicase